MGTAGYRHLQGLLALLDAVAPRGAELVEHHFTADAFGSWFVVLRLPGGTVRLVFEGRDHELVLERSGSPRPPYRWGPAVWRRPCPRPDDLGWVAEAAGAVAGL